MISSHGVGEHCHIALHKLVENDNKTQVEFGRRSVEMKKKKYGDVLLTKNKSFCKAKEKYEKNRVYIYGVDVSNKENSNKPVSELERQSLTKSVQSKIGRLKKNVDDTHLSKLISLGGTLCAGSETIDIKLLSGLEELKANYHLKQIVDCLLANGYNQISVLEFVDWSRRNGKTNEACKVLF